MTQSMKILVVGGGAREHALCWAIRQSPLCRNLYCAPGNAGIAQLAECVAIKPDDVDGLVSFAERNAIDLVVVGPEQPLVLGLVNRLRAKNIKAFGPTMEAAKLEGSKGFMKDLCREYNIPTAKYAFCKTIDAAKKAVQSMGDGKIVVKADGLAAGKGVIIAENQKEALDAIHLLMDAEVKSSVVVEEFLEGEEASFFALVDGLNVLPLTAAQDHKRAFDGDKGPNTGGMGAYSPAPVMTKQLEAEVMQRIIQPTANAMAAKGTLFHGVFFAGLMITDKGPYLLEYNVRFGDPECQALMPRLNGDWVELFDAVASNRLSAQAAPKWHDFTTLGVVMAAKGYPDQYERNTEIKGLENLAVLQDIHLFHAATKKEGGKTLADGGRVLSVVGIGKTASEAQQKAYQAVSQIDWPGGFCRKDIGWRAVAREKKAA